MSKSNRIQLNLTQGQLSLWTSQKLHHGVPLHNVAHTFEISGVIDEKVFKAAFQELLDKTDALRTVFSESDGIPYQSFEEPIKFELESFDFRLKADNTMVDGWVLKRTKKVFDISKRTFDTALLRIEDEKYIWFLNMHHLITDGVTTSQLFAQMSAIYTSLSNNTSEIPKPLPSFKDYISFEKEERRNPDNENNRAFWKAKMEDIEEPPNLYGNKSGTNNTQASRFTVPLGNNLSEQLKEIALHPELRGWTQASTIFNIISTVYLVLLSRVSGQKKIAFGITTHNRTSKKYLRTAGFLMGVLPLLNEVYEEDTFLTLYQRVKSEINVFLKNVKPGLHDSDIGRSYNALLNYILTQLADFNGFPTKSEWIFPGHMSSANSIELHIVDYDTTGNFQLHFDLNHEVFKPELQQYVTQHFTKILEAFIANQDTKLSDISLITKEEIEKIGVWNDTSVPFDETETLLSQFESQVNKSPEAVALIFGEETYTYRALNEKANQVAHLLIKKGVNINDIVAISLERSFEMMVYIYGIIKAGAAYLPLDTANPNERIRFIAEDANFKILFLNHDNLNPDSIKDVECLDIRNMDNQLVSLSAVKPSVVTSPENLAYVIYTSGSTGEPKGVECHHKGICNRLYWMNRDYSINENDTLIQKTPITFDVSLWELFWPLQVGAKLVIEIPNGHKDPSQLIKTIRRNRVSVIHFVPSMLNVFVQSNNAGECISLRRLFCSGEALPSSTVEQTFEKLDQISIHNLYGPTEASVDVTSWDCKKEDLGKGVPIGYPAANTTIYIVDDNLNMVPIGVKGELYIGGIQVASGYLNREQLTKEKFVDDIFSQAPHTKMYKTGDLARYRYDGAIEYLGRTDNQIKIRGIRIELGEIEKVMEQNLDVLQVVVIVDRKDNLFSYYTGDKIVEHKAKNTLLSLLPDYMIPIRFKRLEEIPLTKNGKINRLALEKMDSPLLEQKTTFEAPQTEIEELLTKIWQEVLGISRIGIHDNFIALGGHSLVAIKVSARINQEIEINFSLGKIFELPTIYEYAAYVEETLIDLMKE